MISWAAPPACQRQVVGCGSRRKRKHCPLPYVPPYAFVAWGYCASKTGHEPTKQGGKGGVGGGVLTY